jgi:hypothetical protein
VLRRTTAAANRIVDIVGTRKSCYLLIDGEEATSVWTSTCRFYSPIRAHFRDGIHPSQAGEGRPKYRNCYIYAEAAGHQINSTPKRSQMQTSLVLSSYCPRKCSGKTSLRLNKPLEILVVGGAEFKLCFTDLRTLYMVSGRSTRTLFTTQFPYTV